jgi:hypothetical protein
MVIRARALPFLSDLDKDPFGEPYFLAGAVLPSERIADEDQGDLDHEDKEISERVSNGNV